VNDRARRWTFDIVLGLILGSVTGAILAVNIAIFAGTDDGYEASLSEIFRQRPIVGGAIILVLIGTPLVAIIILRRVRARRGTRS